MGFYTGIFKTYKYRNFLQGGVFPLGVNSIGDKKIKEGAVQKVIGSSFFYVYLSYKRITVKFYSTVISIALSPLSAEVPP